MNDETTLRTNIALWAQQFNDHDVAALATWYTPECVYITPTGLSLVGPEQVRQYFQETFTRSPKAGIKVEVESLTMDSPDLRIGRGTFEVTNALDPKGNPLPMKGPWVATFARRGERWIPLAHASALTLDMLTAART